MLGGCWDHEPPETTAFILMIGFDPYPEDPEQTVITQLAVLPSALATGEQGSMPEGKPFYLLSSNARTLEASQMSVVDHLSRLPRLEHLDALVFGEDFAKDGPPTEAAIAWALRHPQIRPGVLLFIADGENASSAQQFLDATPALDPLPGAALDGLMRHADRVPYIFPTRTYQFARTLLSPRIDGAIPVVTRDNPITAKVPPGFEPQAHAGASGGGASGGSDEMESQIRLLGMAIFKGPTLVGKVIGQDADGLVWIRGRSKAPIAIRHPKYPDRFISATGLGSSAKRTARLETDDKVVLSIQIEANMDVWGEGSLEPGGIRSYVKEIEKELGAIITEKVRRTMRHLQMLQGDIFGFGEELYRKSPRDWDKVAERWDELYANAQVEIKVTVKVLRMGLSR